MGTAADQQAGILFVEEIGLVHNVESTAFVIALGDGGDRTHATPHPDGGKHLPVLLGVEVPKQVLEIPIADKGVALGVMEQGRGPLGVIDVGIIQGLAVEIDHLGCDVVGVAATKTTDVGRFTE